VPAPTERRGPIEAAERKEEYEEQYHTPTLEEKLEAVLDDPIFASCHYCDGGIETLDFIVAKKLDFFLGQVCKYISSRAGKKDPAKELEDLKKAQIYLNRKIELMEKDQHEHNGGCEMTLTEGFVKDEGFHTTSALRFFNGDDQCYIDYPCRFPTCGLPAHGDERPQSDRGPHPCRCRLQADARHGRVYTDDTCDKRTAGTHSSSG
jgi:hypothetical protein